MIVTTHVGKMLSARSEQVRMGLSVQFVIKEKWEGGKEEANKGREN